MDYLSTPCRTPGDELRRLSTFGSRPIPGGLCSGIKNSPSKLASAYFERKSDAVGDEVYCRYCGVTFSNWGNESPAAVHRVISPLCPAVNAPPAGNGGIGSGEFLENLQENPFRKYLPSTVQKQMGPETPSADTRLCGINQVPARRRLFGTPDDGEDGIDAEQPETGSDDAEQDYAASSTVRIHDGGVIKHPFEPVTGNYNDLFASFRQKTYPAAYTQQNQAWAEEGFAFLGDGRVQCVFCGASAVRNGLHPHAVHMKLNPLCPFIMCADVGNISCKQEMDISMKYLQQQNSKSKSGCCQISPLRHPHFEKDQVRMDTFRNWPRMCSSVFPADLMCSAGFYYSGCADKVVCFTCGIELFNWDPEADVWQHHAKLSPTCQFVVRCKGQQFIQQSAEVQILTDIKYPDGRNDLVANNGVVVAEEIGTPTLDQNTVKAALACRYPNKVILLATLQAADENHGTICEQQQVILQKDTQLQEKDTQLQTVIQVKDTQLQEKDTQLQEKDTQLQRVMQDKQQEVQEKDAQLHMQEQLIRQLTQQVHHLRAGQHPLNLALLGPNGDRGQPGADGNIHQRLLCKICLTEESNMIFLPCGHVTSCVACASRLPNKQCPVCRQDISQILPAFVV